MPGKSPTPDLIAEAVTLRAAGYTITAISERLGMSPRTLNRIFERHATKKGAVKQDLIDKARQELVNTITSTDKVREEAARLVADDLAHARLLRQRMAEALPHMTASNLPETVLVMRAAAAYSTGLKNTSDMLRHSLRSERALEAEEAADLPELVIRVVTDEEARALCQDDVDEAEALLPCPTASDAPDSPVATQDNNERLSEGEEAA